MKTKTIVFPAWYMESLGLGFSAQKMVWDQGMLLAKMKSRVVSYESVLVRYPNLPAPRCWSIQGMAGGTGILPYAILAPLLEQSMCPTHTHSIFDKLFLEAINNGMVNKDEMTVIISVGAQTFNEMAFCVVHAAQGERIYTLRSHVVEQLLETQIDLSVPTDMIHAPEEGVVYLELGEQKFLNEPRLSFGDYDIDGQADIDYVDGFYVDESLVDTESLHTSGMHGKTINGTTLLEELELDYSAKIRKIDFCFCGAVNPQKARPTNTGFQFASLIIPVYEGGEELSLTNLIEKHEIWLTRIQSPQSIQAGGCASLLRFACLVLLYVASQSYREVSNELDEARKKLARVGTKKLEKILKQSIRAVNRTYLSPSQSDDSVSAMRADKTLKTHYQKGYISMPPYDDKCSKPKPVWIKPVIVNSDSGESKDIQAKNHVVK